MPLDLADIRWIDERADEFEALLAAGARPRLEDFVAQASGERQARLLEQLVGLDFEYGRMRGGLDAAAYLAKHPDLAEKIATLLVAPAADAPFRVTLRVTKGPHSGQVYEFTGHSMFIVGRGSASHFRLPGKDRYISRSHFMLEVNPPLCRLTDMQSTNCTRINGQVARRADLKHGDVIRIGQQTEIEVRIDAPTPPPHEAGGSATPFPTTAHWSPQAGRGAGAPDLESIWPDDLAPMALPAVPGFRIVRELGSGGMGKVYLALREADQQTLALKLIKPAARPRATELERFWREVEILRQLQHERIVKLYEAGQAGEQLYFAMEYVEGCNGAELLERTAGPLPIGGAVALACQLLEALEYAHARGFIHRDIKPANMLIRGEHHAEQVKLADFGLARAYHSTRFSGLTMAGDVGGTLAYMPPEQILDFHATTPAADQYSAAATLYRLLTNEHLYDFPTDMGGQVAKILHERPVPIESRRGDVPPALGLLIHRALARKPRERFSDVAEFRAAIVPFTKDD